VTNNPSSQAISIRDYVPDDLDALIAVFRGSVRAVARRDYSHDQVMAWAPDEIDRDHWAAQGAGTATFVAVIDGRPVGFADLEADGHIDMLYVDAGHQRRGVARALIGAVETAARGRRLARLHVEASLTARGFFARHGFRVVAPQTVVVRGQEFVNVRMEKPLC